MLSSVTALSYLVVGFSISGVWSMGNYLFATNATFFQKDSYMYEIKKW
jgi:hypothetical protein